MPSVQPYLSRLLQRSEQWKAPSDNTVAAGSTYRHYNSLRAGCAQAADFLVGSACHETIAPFKQVICWYSHYCWYTTWYLPNNVPECCPQWFQLVVEVVFLAQLLHIRTSTDEVVTRHSGKEAVKERGAGEK